MSVDDCRKKGEKCFISSDARSWPYAYYGRGSSPSRMLPLACTMLSKQLGLSVRSRIGRVGLGVFRVEAKEPKADFGGLSLMSNAKHGRQPSPTKG